MNNMNNTNKKTYLTLSLLFSFIFLFAYSEQRFSTAGFYTLKNTGRTVYSMNPAWRLHKGDINNAEKTNFDDSTWQVVSLPDGIEIVPEEASGSVNYQGVVWYRKHFTPNNELQGKKLFLHFEAIMGKSRIYVNGKLLKEHFGGYLPVIVDISNALKWNEDNVIAVWADNSNDPIYPPGKAQDVLDFTYMGGIYRDCWLISHNDIYITDPNYENKVANGGLLVAFDNVSEKSADIQVKLHARNEQNKNFKGKLLFNLKDKDGKIIASRSKNINIKSGEDITFNEQIKNLKDPQLWSPESPYLYNLEVFIKDSKGKTIDGYRQRVGIRSFEFKQKDGFWLNGKPYPAALIGGNRHQDYALVGNAVANSAHWRDAKKMRDAGLKVVRNAHYPQDPAFMDACDELGLLVIVNTPGWQFWNEDPIFEERVYEDIRNMVRRDRNHASLWMWEPILNETWYPEEFAQNTRKVVEEEFPFANNYCASDSHARGSDFFDIHFSHPTTGSPDWALKKADPTKSYFTREWGDNVDDWSSHNSPSRVSREWGEEPMLVQTRHYINPHYPFSSYNSLFEAWKQSPQHIGGTLWHTFDHQRGYHPDPFYGGIMDAFRQTKTSYYAFQTQQKPFESRYDGEVEPMVYIANTMTPFSSKDVTVFSNCDEVRLRFNKDGEEKVYIRNKDSKGIDYPIILFENSYDFMAYSSEKRDDAYLEALGYIDGKEVAKHRVYPSRRPTKITLSLDNDSKELIANGSDFVTVIATITDNRGTVKRLNNYKILFEVIGEGELINNEASASNPKQVSWGTAPALIRSTTQAGEITIRARLFWEGSQMPEKAELTIHSTTSDLPLIYNNEEWQAKSNSNDKAIGKIVNERSDQEKLKEVEKQQTEFGEKKQLSLP